jgi:SAM-dependent methyltransferase
MRRSVQNDRCSSILEPSVLVRQFASRMIEAAAEKPILDVACGSGRNAIFLSQFHCNVICIDKDLTDLRQREADESKALSRERHRLELRQLNLVEDPWPFGQSSVGGIVNIHFFLPSLFPLFERSLSPGAYLIFESVPGCGGNYLELPPAGYVRSLLTIGFEIEVYKERKVGPPGRDAVTTLTVAKRTQHARPRTHPARRSDVGFQRES